MFGKDIFSESRFSNYPIRSSFETVNWIELVRYVTLLLALV
jgi:hypothetical protein